MRPLSEKLKNFYEKNILFTSSRMYHTSSKKKEIIYRCPVFTGNTP